MAADALDKRGVDGDDLGLNTSGVAEQRIGEGLSEVPDNLLVADAEKAGEQQNPDAEQGNAEAASQGAAPCAAD
jgi:hypothetical protein